MTYSYEYYRTFADVCTADRTDDFFQKENPFRKKAVCACASDSDRDSFFHILGLISLHLPYGGSLKPSELYKTDTEIEEQVRQLGMLTMLRLDIKHSIFGVDRNLSFDSSDLEKIDSLQGAAGNRD